MTTKTCIECGTTQSRQWLKGPKCSRCYEKMRNRRDAPKRAAMREKRREYKRAWDREHHYSSQKFGKAKYEAKRRDKIWTLSQCEYEEETSKPCYYCNNILGKEVTSSIGLDRIDNSKGYELGNVHSCCYTCNKIKNDTLSVVEMKQVAAFIIQLRKD